MRLLVKIFLSTFLFLIFSCHDNNLLGPQLEQEIIENDLYGSWKVDNFRYETHKDISTSLTVCGYRKEKFYCEENGIQKESEFEGKFEFHFNTNGTFIIKDRLNNTLKGIWSIVDNKIEIKVDEFDEVEDMDYSIHNGILKLTLISNNDEYLEIYLHKDPFVHSVAFIKPYS